MNGVSQYELQIATDPNFHEDLHVLDNIGTAEFRLPSDYPFNKNILWWRVRASDESGKWSAFSSSRMVRLSERRLSDEYSYAQHPRLFINKGTLASLRERISTDPSLAETFAKIKSKADESLGTEAPLEDEVTGATGQHGGFNNVVSGVARGTLEPLAFTYLITGEEKYAETARLIMLQLVSYSRWVGMPFGDPDAFNPTWSAALETGGMCKGIATAYDWIHDYLSEEDRQIIRDGIVRLGIRPLIHDWADPETHWLIPRHQLAAGNWWSVCNSGAGIAALALLGEEPEAHLWVRLVEDAIRWFLVYSGGDVWNIHLRGGGGYEYMAVTEPNWGVDAGYLESIGYIGYGLVNTMYFIEALKNVTGVDLSVDLRRDILNQPLYGLFHDAERGYVTVNFNDSGVGPNLGSDIYSLIARHTQNPHVQWMLEETWGGPDDIHSLLAYDDSLAAESPEELPKIKRFRDIGWIFFRTGWGKSDSLFAAKFHQGRGHEDLGQFVIYHKGRQQVIDPGTFDYADPIYQTFLNQTKAHNVVMVNGERQWRLDGKITDFLAADVAGFAVADITDAYQDLLDKWHRGVAFLDDRVYIVWDELSAEEPRDFSWLLHPGGEFRTEGSSVYMGKEDALLNLHLLSDAVVEPEILPGYIVQEQHPYVSFNVSRRKNSRFLGVFVDGKFSSVRKAGETAAEFTSPDGACFVSLGGHTGLENDPVSHFEGELVVVFGEAGSAPDKFIAHRCSQLLMNQVSVTSRQPVNIVGIRQGNKYIIVTDEQDTDLIELRLDSGLGAEIVAHTDR